MKIGLPRALFYFRYGQFWREFLTNLGLEVIISPKTNKEILEQGLKVVSSEICLPIKIVCGHIEYLKNKVDAIFLPRFVKLNRLYACPKMIGIADIVEMQCENSCLVLSPKISNNFLFAHFLVGLRLIKNPQRVINALQTAQVHLSNQHLSEQTNRVNKPKILLLSHFYNLADDFISRDIKDGFTNLGFEIVTKENLNKAILNRTDGFAQKIRWVYERELYNAFRYYLDKVNGVCTIISFGCGPDSLISEMMLSESNILNLPYLQLIIDEHTSKTGLLTRIEAFAEVINYNLNRQLTSN
ncbi:MAG: acyl-CoA dehydratase activase-related protein [candidate division WOR-3 bacterium]